MADRKLYNQSMISSKSFEYPIKDAKSELVKFEANNGKRSIALCGHTTMCVDSMNKINVLRCILSDAEIFLSQGE